MSKEIIQMKNFSTSEYFLMGKEEKKEYVSKIIEIAKEFENNFGALTKHQLTSLIYSKFLVNRSSVYIALTVAEDLKTLQFFKK